MTEKYSGKFVVRIPPPLHENLKHQAGQKGVSLNSLCARFLQEGLKKRPEKTCEAYKALLKKLKSQFGRNLTGLLIIGSRVSGTATASSDRDFLVVLSDAQPLARSLYQWWDEDIPSPKKEQWSPQYVHLPSSPMEAGSLWLETAMMHKIVWEKGSAVTNFITQLMKIIETDQVRRYWSQGHPYWVWRNHEEQNACK